MGASFKARASVPRSRDRSRPMLTARADAMDDRSRHRAEDGVAVRRIGDARGRVADGDIARVTDCSPTRGIHETLNS